MARKKSTKEVKVLRKEPIIEVAPWETEEEVEAMFGCIDLSDCPCCWSMHTLKNQGDGTFKCLNCGFEIDELDVIEDVLGLSKFPMHQ